MQNFGKERVLEPKGFFPVSAWRLDNRREISSNEMRVKCNRIKLEEENFRQLCNSCDRKNHSEAASKGSKAFSFGNEKAGSKAATPPRKAKLKAAYEAKCRCFQYRNHG